MTQQFPGGPPGRPGPGNPAYGPGPGAQQQPGPQERPGPHQGPRHQQPGPQQPGPYRQPGPQQAGPHRQPGPQPPGNRQQPPGNPQQPPGRQPAPRRGAPFPGPSTPPGPKRGNTRLVVVAVVLVVALVAGGAIWWFVRDTPQKAIDRYFTSLGYANATSTSDWDEVLVSPPSETTLKQMQEFSPRASYSVVSVTVRGQAATVAYVVDGTPQTSVLQLKQDGSRWKIVNGLARLQVRSTDQIPVGANQSTMENLPAGEIEVFPGPYRLRTPFQTGIASASIEPAVDPFFLQPGEVKNIDVAYRLTDQGKGRTQQTIISELNKCLRQTGFELSGCPLRYPRPPDASDNKVFWSVSNQDPSAVQLLGDSTVKNACGRITTTATISYYTARFEKREITTPISLTGCVDAAAGGSTVNWR